MAAENESTTRVDEDEEIYPPARPRRRFRGSHWRHASQSQTPPPQAYSSPRSSPPQIRPLSLSRGHQQGNDALGVAGSPQAGNYPGNALVSETPTSAESYTSFSKSFANELSKVFNIDEDPLVVELESSVREKNHRLSMQTSELEMLSQRIREAEERLRRVEEENEESSLGRPTPPVSPDKISPPKDKKLEEDQLPGRDDVNDIVEIYETEE